MFCRVRRSGAYRPPQLATHLEHNNTRAQASARPSHTPSPCHLHPLHTSSMTTSCRAPPDVSGAAWSAGRATASKDAMSTKYFPTDGALLGRGDEREESRAATAPEEGLAATVRDRTPRAPDKVTTSNPQRSPPESRTVGGGVWYEAASTAHARKIERDLPSSV